jgi:Leucine-rich repeat (LRR) protein
MKSFTLLPPDPFVAGILTVALVLGSTQAAENPQMQAPTALRFDLQSDYIPSPARVPTTQGTLEVRSVGIRGELSADDSGQGAVLFDPRLALLNEFGDVIGREGPQPEPIRVRLRRVTPDEITEVSEPFGTRSNSPQWRNLYSLDFPDGQVTGTVRLKLGEMGFGPHRLLLYTAKPGSSRQTDSGAPQVLTLTGEPGVRSNLPDKPWSTRVNLSGTYNAEDGAYRRIGLEGSLGGAGKLSLDPNYITVDAFGEPGMTTLMGFQPHPVTIRPVETADPLGLERRLYQVLSDDPRNANRCFLVLGKTEAAAHRLLLYQGDSVRLIVPMSDPNRRRQETAQAELNEVSSQEQQAIAALREIMGYGFTYTVAQGKVTRLNVGGQVELSPFDAALADLPHLESLELYGRLSPPGLPSLGKLSQLKNLSFSSVRVQPEATAFLQTLDRLESLSFYISPGVDDTVLRHMSGLTNLRFLRIYDELPPGVSFADHPHVTDRGLAMLTDLRALESLDLFGEGITDTGLVSLRHLKNLKSLNFHSARVTVPGLIQFAARSPATQVRATFMVPASESGGFEVTLEYQAQSAALQGDIPEAVIEQISAWSTLKRLRIDALTQVTDDGVRHLAPLTHLESLALHNGHRLSNDALKHLQGLVSLKELSLFACPNITDAGLAHLKTLTALESLELGQTRVTDHGIAQLQKQLPNCAIQK